MARTPVLPEAIPVGPLSAEHNPPKAGIDLKPQQNVAMGVGVDGPDGIDPICARHLQAMAAARVARRRAGNSGLAQ